jgi:hypothetical protein
MLNKPYVEQSLLYVPLILCVVWLGYMMQISPLPDDVGDGIQHFFISQASWKDPSLFLNHWGKPFFILLSSPFSQFGFQGMVVFNILVFIGISLISIQILREMNVSVWLQMLLAPTLLKAHDISNTILGGLTEPLFNLSLVIAFWLLLRKRFYWFAITVSCMPFLRSEGQLPVMLALGLLIFYKEFKAIPFLLTAFLIYSILGFFVLDDFWWYFTKSPYQMSNDIYGQGTWYHYLLSYRNYLGNGGLFICLATFCSIIYFAVFRKKIILTRGVMLFSMGTFLGVVAAHSYFWATGQNGSLGLTRVATQGVPVFFLTCLYIMNQHTWLERNGSKILLGCFSLGTLVSVYTSKSFPKEVSPMEKQVIQAGEYLKKYPKDGTKIYFHFPLLPFVAGENPLLPSCRFRHHAFHNLESDLKYLLKPGDLIARDSHFGPVEMGLPNNQITSISAFVAIKIFESTEQLEDPLHETEGVVIYTFRPHAPLQ